MRALIAGLLAFCLTALASPYGGCETEIKVAVYDDRGVTRSVEDAIKAISAGGFQTARIKATQIRAGRLAGFDALVLPGGIAAEQAAALGTAGREEIRRFVRAGGGYVGICAGAYLACSCFSWSLGILDARTVDGEHWARGVADVRIELTPDGMRIFGTKRARETIQYRQGPLLAPDNRSDIPDYQELAWFSTEVAQNGAPKGVMIGTTAVAAGDFGQGRVLCFSPHPELTAGLEFMLQRGVAWTAGVF